ncbi:hypothetical protein [Cellulosilyticum sp. I15G10I2]|nr:hypothetical protein [Cellulosilyticum sp. I15G10I2]
MAKDDQKNSNEKTKQDDILSIVEQFVCYFEKIDRGEKIDDSIRNS